jgi:hypothetical protein
LVHLLSRLTGIFRSHDNSVNSPLLSVAPETRNLIYMYALGGRILHVHTFHPCDGHGRKARELLIIYECHAKVHDIQAAFDIRCSTAPTAVESYRQRHTMCLPVGPVGIQRRYSVALLQTCRQIHSEAALTPFCWNTFAFLRGVNVQALIRRTLKVQQRAIRYVTFVNEPDRTDVTEPMKILPGIKLATINLELRARDWHTREDYLNMWQTAFSHLSDASVLCCAYCECDCHAGVHYFTYPSVLNSLCLELEMRIKGHASEEEA